MADVTSSAPHATSPVPSWQTVYCCLVLILVVFFLTVLSRSQPRLERMSQVAGQLAGTGQKKPGITVSNVDREGHDGVRDAEAAAIRRWIAERGMRDRVSVTVAEPGIIVAASSVFWFGPAGTGNLTTDARSLLDTVSSAATSAERIVQAVGYVDVSPRLTEDDWRAWEGMAKGLGAILRRLSQGGGVPPSRLDAACYPGKSRGWNTEESGRGVRLILRTSGGSVGRPF